MSAVIVTGSSGLIGSETVRFFHQRGFDVAGIDNNMRADFFGQDGSVTWNADALAASLPQFRQHAVDIRDASAVEDVFKYFGKSTDLVVHCAAQPSHEWAAREPMVDFTINAVGTLALLEATRKCAPEAVFIFMSTNKVYGDQPNTLPLVEAETRWELDSSHHWSEHGIDESMSIDQTQHSVFGASKVAADVMAQEYGRYFGMRVGVFRAGCVTGPAHSGAELHGFLAYLVRCAVTGRLFTIHGYGGKQVRDNIHSSDLVHCFWDFYRKPRPGAVYNIGGSRHSNCSVLEAIDVIKEVSGYDVTYRVSESARSGDHMWWVSDVRKWQRDFPSWSYMYDLRATLREMLEAASERYAGVIP